jgi:ABC-type nitrate/sulfonate/bicarbonate transport systems, periplasmic components
MKKGEIDAISNLDPMMTKLEQEGDITVVADSRTEEGTRAIFGGSNPAAVLYARQDFIDKNPNTMQALVNAFYKTLQWLEKATPEQIAATVPEEYFLGDKALYVRCRQGQQAGLFAHRRCSRRGHEIGRRHAACLRRGAQRGQHRPRKDL